MPLRATARLAFAALAAASGLGCPRAPREVAYDLAERLPYAERWSSRDVLLFGTPASEPHQAEGFYREAAPAEGDPFVWSKGEGELALTWPSVRPRFAVVDLAPYKGVKGQTAEVRLNGSPVARFTLNDARYRYGFALPAEGQRVGDNRLRLVFAATASPAEEAGSADRRQLAAAFYSLVVGDAADPGLQDLLGRDAPRPFAVTKADGVPTLVEIGPAVVRYAIRVPSSAELRFRPTLHAAARAAGASASFRVTEEATAGEERELWSAVLGPQSGTPEEVRVALRAKAGDIVRIGLHVGAAGATGERFAWGLWGAPRVMGQGGGEAGGTRPSPSEEDRKRVDGLRAALGTPNVLFVILDAGRADHFGAYGYGRPTTPNIDRFAREGVVFERAFTPAVYTLGAMSSVWTSQYPDRHHAEVSFAAQLPKDRLTLAELLGAQGIHTAGFVSNVIAGSFNGFDRGFTEFHEVFREQGTSAADGLARTVPGWIASQAGRRFFAYVHFREPHCPYNPPPPFDTRFGPEGPITSEMRMACGPGTWVTEVNQGRRPLSAAEKDHLVRLYDGNLASADDVMGQIRAALEKANLLERTVVIISADHGEALFEHGWIGHNVQLYDESVHVPLIVRFPAGQGPPAGTRIGTLADLLDVAPTIADLFGVMGRGGSDRRFQGRSLLPAVLGAKGETAILSRTVWDRPRYARRDAGHKFVYDTRTGEEELYDLARDPGEKTNLVASDPLRAAWSRQELHHWIASAARAATA
ncbi:MAG TPA: sulfatase, partial [Vicinamibacteria bacterium]|nr:sulfatase [Vicinamibacteria bacterium]